ncbi:MAG: hypothetical protein KDA17_00040 [Candidatus Saccharibacteria bacterium]|nr:hypothetical protein [Candidatus Saccharibacteria bacterium]
MIEKKMPVGGLNSDDAKNEFPEGDYQVGQNIMLLSRQAGEVGKVVSIPGNTHVPVTGIDDPVLQPGLLVVGSYSEDETGRLFYFVANSSVDETSDDFLIMYDSIEDEFKFVVTGELLQLNQNRITGVAKVGPMLYWAQEGQPPKGINVERGLRAYDGAYVSADGTTPVPYDIANIDTSQITIIKRPPIFPLEVSRTLLGLDSNFVSKLAWQFAYRYVYINGETSVLSPYSELINYAEDGLEADHDAVSIVYPAMEVIPKEVQRVEFFARAGNTGSFFWFNSIDRDEDAASFTTHEDGDELLFYFQNDINGYALPDQQSSKPFDSVPIESKSLEAARDRIFLANNKVGYDRPTSITMNLTVAVAPASELTGVYTIIDLESDDSGVSQRVVLVLIDEGGATDGYYWYRYYAPGSSLTEFTLGTLPTVVTLASTDKVAEASDDLATLAAAIDAELLIRQGVDMDLFAPLGYTPSLDPFGAYPGADVGVAGIGAFVGNFEKFKADSTYQIGVLFFDKWLRHAGVSSHKDNVATIPQRTFTDVSERYSIEWQITSPDADIPDWAHYFAVVRTKSLNYQSFIQFVSGDILYLTKDEDGLYDISASTRTYSDDIQYLGFNINAGVNHGLGYQFREGDRLTVFSDDVSYPDPIEFNVVDQVGSYVIVDNPTDLGDTTPGDAGPNEYMLVEIYTPKIKDSNELYYEVGSGFYMINNPGTSSKEFSETIGAMTAGDVWVKARDYSLIEAGLTAVKTECMNPRDMVWSEWVTDCGRATIDTKNGMQEVVPTGISYSNKWIPGTELNGLSSFDALDYSRVPNENGAIRKLVLVGRGQELGTVMLAISESETASIYLGETQLVDAADQAIVATSGNVIGTIKNLVGSFGTIHPESVAVSDSNAYWLDALAGKVIRYSSGGMFPISDYKMAKYFRELSRQVYDEPCVATYDIDNDLYLLHMGIEYNSVALEDYVKGTLDPHIIRGNSVLAFSEPLKRWVAEYLFAPTWIDQIRGLIVSWSVSSMYTHNNETKNEFYGVATPSTISFPVNKNPSSVKAFAAVIVEANTPPDWVHIQVKHPYLQSSDIEDEEFEDREGVYYAQIKLDRLTPGFGGNYLAAMNSGDSMRGRVANIAIQYLNTTDFEFECAHVIHEDSIGHPAGGS